MASTDRAREERAALRRKGTRMSNHECPAPGCSKSVPFEMLACRGHWYAISKPTRDAVWSAYRGPGPGSPEHTAAITAAISELQERYGRRNA